MKRLITALVILLVVVVAGMTALVLLVNPNDFRAYMVRQVEQRSGYQLALNGELRWHVWPQLSILSGPVTLTAPGASQSVISAENMRLDVKLLPLLSHQLSVKEVMLKGTVVRLIPESESQRPSDAPVGPAGATSPNAVDDVTRGWKFDIAHLRIVDSLLVWQQSDGKQLNVRDFNLKLDQTQPHKVSIEFSSYINRDQRELQLYVNSDLDITDYPRQLHANVSQLDYQLQGADLPLKGIKGQAVMKASWNNQTQHFSLNDISLSANDSQLSGTLSGSLGQRLQLVARLKSTVLNLDSLLGLASSDGNGQNTTSQRAGHAPVIAEANANSPLNAMDGELTLNVDQMIWRNMALQHVLLQGGISDGLLTVNLLKGQFGAGNFSLPGVVDVRNLQTKVMLGPVVLERVALTPLLQAFELPDTVSGELSLKGEFTGTGLTVSEFKRRWAGRADFKLGNAQFAGLNFQQLIERSVEESSDKVRSEYNEDQPNLQQISGNVTLDNGQVQFASLAAHSAIFGYNGSGNIDLAKKQLDMNFGVVITKGWIGDDMLVQRLQQTPVPLRIYGPWSMINYNLKVDQVLRQQLRDEAKQRLKEWVGRNPGKEKNSEVNKLIKDM